MLASTESVALIGTDAHLVQVEVDVSVGVPKLTFVGLPATSVREAEQRMRSALQSSNERWPPKRMVANLAPAALRKEGTHFDLPMAIGIVAADERLDPEALKGWVIVGELALDGSVRPVRGTLAAAITCRTAERRGVICPAANAAEAGLVGDIEVVPVTSLEQCLGFLRGNCSAPKCPDPKPLVVDEADDMSQVRGHVDAKEALEIAAAGGHNVLLSGPPGAGKTMLARRLPGILPSMSVEESLEATRIYSVAGLLSEKASLITQRPFRSPHHHISVAGLIGGGSRLPRPGEVTLAHLGVLFLDELPLFKPTALESLRGPIEDGIVRLARSGGATCYPSRFSLIAAMNPCPCGYRGDLLRSCNCSPHRIDAYLQKLSGPLLDRFDMQITLRRLSKEDLMSHEAGEPSRSIRKRVEMARSIQTQRYGRSTETNASANVGIGSFNLTDAATHEVGARIERGLLTARGLARVLRVARTVADLDGAEVIDEIHVSRAAKFRLLGSELEMA